MDDPRVPEHRLRQRAAHSEAALACDLAARAHQRAAGAMERLGRFERRDELLGAVIRLRDWAAAHRRAAVVHGD